MVQETRRLHGKDMTVSKELAEEENLQGDMFRQFLNRSVRGQSVYIVIFNEREVYVRCLNVVFTTIENGINLVLLIMLTCVYFQNH